MTKSEIGFAMLIGPLSLLAGMMYGVTLRECPVAAVNIGLIFAYIGAGMYLMSRND